MAEVKQQRKAGSLNIWKKKCQAGETALAVAKLLIKTAVRTILTAPLQKPICAFTLGLLLRTASLRVSGSTLTTALVSKCRLVITGYDFWTGSLFDIVRF